jgi:hypothetical protein
LLGGLVLADADVILLQRDHGDVGLQDRCQYVPQPAYFFVDLLQVVVDVTEEWFELLTDVRVPRPLQGVEGS